MDYLNFGGMDDDLFRRDFLNFLNQHQKRMNDFMKRMYSKDELGSDDTFNKLMSRLSEEGFNVENGEDEYGTWGKSNWTSQDGSINYDSYFREYNPYKELKPQPKNTQEVSTLGLLESKLKKAIMKEDYESAAKIRDLIKSLEDKK